MGQKIVIIDTSYPINTRNQKIVDTLNSFLPDAKILVIAWNRDNRLITNADSFFVYNQVAKYGSSYEKMKYLYGFHIFVKNVLLDINPDVIIASHWDSLLIIPSMFKNKKIIYENLDIPTGPLIIRKIVKLFEWKALKNVDLIIHASRFFQQLYPQSIPQIVLENKPNFAKFNIEYKPLSLPIVISYIGNVRYANILKNLIDAIGDNDKFVLYIHGFGPDLTICKEYAAQYQNIFFTGEFQYCKVKEFYANTDFVWAVYPNKDFNVKYAISNKFHESILFNVPGIFADKTCLGEFVLEKGIGITVDPYDVNNIKNSLLNITNDKIEKIRANIKQLSDLEKNWEEDFQKVLDYL